MTRPLSHYPYQDPEATSSDTESDRIKLEPMEQVYAYRDPGIPQYEPYGSPDQFMAYGAPPPGARARHSSEDTCSGSYQWRANTEESDESYVEPKTRCKKKAAPTNCGPARSYRRKGEEEKKSPEYIRKRQRNNIAVRESRKRAAEARIEVQRKTAELVDENSKLSSEVRVYRDVLQKLQKEIRVYQGQGLFCQLPSLKQIAQMNL